MAANALAQARIDEASFGTPSTTISEDARPLA
jgi:hypothetical protein